MALVTVADLRKYMSDANFSSSQLATAEDVLQGTQEALEVFLGRPVQPVQVREKRSSNANGDIALSVTPVHKIISIKILGGSATTPTKDTTPLSEDEADRIFDTLGEDNIIIPGGVYVSRANTWFVAEYIGGYNGYADTALKLAIMEVASRTMTFNSDDVLSIKSDFAHEPASAQSITKGWRDEELFRFNRLRRRTAV